jgi:hypothetical protein
LQASISTKATATRPNHHHPARIQQIKLKHQQHQNPSQHGHLEPLGAEQAPEKEEQSKHSKRSRPSIQEVQGKHPVVQCKHQGEASQEQGVK